MTGEHTSVTEPSETEVPAEGKDHGRLAELIDDGGHTCRDSARGIDRRGAARSALAQSFRGQPELAPVVDELGRDRRLVMITGPGHGPSGDPGRHYSMEDCADAASSVLDALGIEESVDWVGNAWGGHVGIVLAAQQPQRVRTLTTVGTPVHGYTLRGRAETQALLALHCLFGPTRFLRDSITDALLSERTRAQDPDAVDLVQDCFSNADRAGLRNAVVSISLRRRDLGPLLPSIQVPTLFVTGSEHREWTPELARNASRSLPQGSVSVLDGAAYLGPLETPREFIRLVRHFWASHPPAPQPPEPAAAG